MVLPASTSLLARRLLIRNPKNRTGLGLSMRRGASATSGGGRDGGGRDGDHRAREGGGGGHRSRPPAPPPTGPTRSSSSPPPPFPPSKGGPPIVQLRRPVGSSNGNKGNRNHRGSGAKELSFDERFLLPASRGELSPAHRHGSGIPRLAARRHKARLVPPDPSAAASAARILMEDEEEGEEEEEGGGGTSLKRFLPVSNSSPPSSSDASPPPPRRGRSAGIGDYYAVGLIDDARYYWREEEHEPLAPKGDDGIPEDLLYNEEGLFEVEFGKDDLAESVERYALLRDEDGDDDEAGEGVVAFGGGGGDDPDDAGGDDGRDAAEGDADEPGRRGRTEAWEYQDPDEDFFFNQNDVFRVASMGLDQFKGQQAESNLVLPLRSHGPELDDFLEAVVEHPTKYAQIASIRPHVESTREPKPIFPKNRLHPPADFVEAHARFLYVSGLPPLEVDGEAGDLDNRIHQGFLQRTVAGLVNVDSSAVFPVTTSSAFVGFPSPAALARALEAGPAEPVIVSPPAIALWRGPVPDVFSDKGGAVVELSNVPPGNNARTLIRALFPPGSEVETVYGNVTPQDFSFRSSTNVLLRFSQEQAESAVGSMLIEKQLESLGRYQPMLVRARRELVHAGYDGPNRSTEKRVMGPRLIVDGDMPSRSFYLSHAGAIQVRNLDPAVAPSELSAAFDRYCARRRDVAGSIELATCHAGRPTGCAYVGFDAPGEAEAAFRDLSGILHIGETRARLKLVRDRQEPGRPAVRVEKRGERSAEELLGDLNNWERYVNPEDLRTLEQAGVAKVVLDEALRNIRYSNKTFGSFDSALRSEALEPQKMTGELYKELVQLYISTLIDCIATEDNVGEMYKATHFPDEPIDLSVFQNEKKRQTRLLEKRTTTV